MTLRPFYHDFHLGKYQRAILMADATHADATKFKCDASRYSQLMPICRKGLAQVCAADDSSYTYTLTAAGQRCRDELLRDYA